MKHRELFRRIVWRAADPKTRTDSAYILPTALATTATPDTIARTEELLGFDLPTFWRDLYTLVGNGGFGPGYGIVGALGGHTTAHNENIASLYRLWRSVHGTPDEPEWPERVVPVCDWGSAIWSCLDCRRAEPRIIVSDCGRFLSPADRAMQPATSHSSPESWLDAWADGHQLWDHMFPDRPLSKKALVNPFTGEIIRPERP